jgi:methyl-accepting chemotaxis protein
MNLRRKSTLTLGGLLLLLTAIDGMVVQQALTASGTVRDFRAQTSVLKDAVARARSDFYTYDGANNMYILVAATAGPSGRELSASTYAGAQQTAQRLHSEVEKAHVNAGATALANVLARLDEDLKGYDSLFAKGYRQVTAGQYAALRGGG